MPIRPSFALFMLTLACGSPEGAEAPESPAAAAEAEGSAPSPTEPPAGDMPAAPAATAPAVEEDTTPAVELLHAVPSTVTVSSAYRDQAAQAARLVDGDLESAWNSRTGDLTGAWIEFELPAEARVRELLLTAGFTHVARERDLFDGNRRVAEVRVTRGEETLGTFPLDPESRELQRLAVSGPGGTYRLTVTRLVEGSRPDWRETCVSELRVMGSAPGAEAGAHTPSARVAAGGGDASGEGEGAEPAAALAPTEPAPANATDAAYFRVAGRGLLQLSAAGVETLTEGAVVDFAVHESGSVHFLAADPEYPMSSSRLFVVDGGERREIATPSNESFSIVAVEPRGAPVLAGAFGIWRRRGAGWRVADAMDARAPEDQAEQPQDLVIGPDGISWARGQHSVFRGYNGTYQREALVRRGDARIIAFAAGPAGVLAAASNHRLHVRREFHWTEFERPLGDAALREVGVGADGVVVAGAYDAAVVVPPTGEPIAVPLPGTGITTAVSIDARGRAWIGSTGGLVVLGPDHAVLRRWPRAQFPGLGGAIQDLAVTGRGPELR